MTNDFSPIDPSESEGSMFAPIPSWERGKKRRAFGARPSRVAAEPRSFAPADVVPTRPVTLSEDARAYEARMDTVDPTDTAFDTGFASGATFADRTSRKGNGAGPILIAAGVILVGGLAAAGWYATQPHNTGVAELTPGSTTTTTQVASSTPADALAPPTTEPAPPTSPAPARSVTTTTTRAPTGAVSHTTVTRARPASEASADASATAPPARLWPCPCRLRPRPRRPRPPRRRLPWWAEVIPAASGPDPRRPPRPR